MLLALGHLLIIETRKLIIWLTQAIIMGLADLHLQIRHVEHNLNVRALRVVFLALVAQVVALQTAGTHSQVGTQVAPKEVAAADVVDARDHSKELTSQDL